MLEPFGAVGPTTAAACRCGAPPHAEHAGRCAAGHVAGGNSFALVAGQHSSRFWAEHQAQRRGIVAAVVADAGHSPDDAPCAFLLAADGLAQAALLRDAAFLRVVQSAGPLTSAGRTRRAYSVWLTASSRVTDHLRLVGLRRVPKTASTLAEYLTQRADVVQRAADASHDPESEEDA